MSRLVASVLPAAAAQADAADQTRSVSPQVIDALKSNPVMRLSAASEIGGPDAAVLDIGEELEALAGACGSSAWCLWNHLSTFHFFCGLLGPDNADRLAEITAAGQWVCFPAGAGTGVSGRAEGAEIVLNGRAAFGSGARYADFAGVSFVPEGERAVRFALIDLRAPGVRIAPTWKAMSLRASATDDLHYADVRHPLARTVPFPMPYRVRFREADHPMISPRYREDWVGLSDLWLGFMAVGVARAAFDEACGGIRDRIALLGVRMADRPTVHVNLGQADAMIAAARGALVEACRATDARIARRTDPPTEADYLAQIGTAMVALRLCDDAMRLVLRVLGGNGLREGPAFERRYRDFQAMPLHINAHPDRVSELLGRGALGLPTESAF